MATVMPLLDTLPTTTAYKGSNMNVVLRCKNWETEQHKDHHQDFGDYHLEMDVRGTDLDILDWRSVKRLGTYVEYTIKPGTSIWDLMRLWEQLGDTKWFYEIRVTHDTKIWS